MLRGVDRLGVSSEGESRPPLPPSTGGGFVAPGLGLGPRIGTSKPGLPPVRGRSAARRTSRPWIDRPFAVIDLGSNSARLVIYRSAPVGPPWSIHENKEYPRLVNELGDDGYLTRKARHSGGAAMLEFQRLLKLYGVTEVHAVATSAVREARNGPEFAEEIQRRCGFPLRILTSDEEARYAYLGVASALPLEKDLIMDLGGGSLQAMAVRNGRLQETLSLPLGVVRLHRKFLKHDPPKPKELEALEDHVDKGLRSLGRLKAGRGERIIGVGGTTRSLARALQAVREYPIARVHGYTLRTRDLERLYSVLSESSTEVRREMPGISSTRADIIVAGLAVVLGVLHRRDADSLTVSGCGIREGIAQEVLDRTLPATTSDMAQGSALATLWALGMDAGHARRVREIALNCFDTTVRFHHLEEEERLALEVAALLHDVGITLSYPDHATHSAYFLRNRPLYGLTHRGFLLASLAAGMHEGDYLSDNVAKRHPLIASRDDLEVARILGGMLALAESIGDSHPRPRLSLREARLRVEVSPGTPVDSRLLHRAGRWLKRSLEVTLDARER
ncbi:MAG: Ppx/GppA family phosphatase [Candidatus Thermoplasmatota archaeon]|nr:Ppx/GppA family phosphatase [Candidatus Thermoplasmatota archaeon]MCL5983975.1 Ppx/GppA family phosphatase [Candidatus Thermoplasmatota archaeon]